ncbi:hypothetical protein [Streptomyces sp. NBC_00258]|uniref:hypothetical protein n=1 Tax=Streptomyces sp. NBC_00258 TaxID=2903642 RepID=UPI002E285AD7|nr:hypothetical protein [Streptomyces sp. NBC_00258]
MEGFTSTLPCFIASDPDLQVSSTNKLEASRRPELQRHVDALYDAYRDGVREALACFGASQELVEIVFAALEGSPTRAPRATRSTPRRD